MTPANLQLCSGTADQLELTPQGHAFALSDEYESVISALQDEARSLTGKAELDLVCPACPVTGPDRGAAMPPVVSWLRPQGESRSERFLLHLQPGQACFQGHFPGQAILPGIIQLHWAVRLAQTCLGCTGVPREIDRLKFHNIAEPPRFVQLELLMDANRRVEFRVLSRDRLHAQGKLVFEGGD